MLLLHSHCEHQWHLVFAKIMNNMLFWGFILKLYTHTSSVCCMVLLGTSPTSFLLNFRGSHFLFSGLTAGPTYRPPVWHSNPDTPLLVKRSQLSRPIRKIRFFAWEVVLVTKRQWLGEELHMTKLIFWTLPRVFTISGGQVWFWTSVRTRTA